MWLDVGQLARHFDQGRHDMGFWEALKSPDKAEEQGGIVLSACLRPKWKKFVTGLWTAWLAWHCHQLAAGPASLHQGPIFIRP